MLNRNAEALFWVGRYMERAENHARLIDIHYHIQHEHDFENEGHKWTRLVDALGARMDYLQQFESFQERDVLSFITLDRGYSNSLFSCVSQARANLRTLREKLPSEMWDVLNAFYLWLGEQQLDHILRESPHPFFTHIKDSTSTFYGVAQSVMLRENEWHFIEAGRFLERADNTVRILRSVNAAIREDQAPPYLYLMAVLKSVSGYQAFRRHYADAMSAEHIAEFLVSCPTFPRSVNYAMAKLEEHLKGIEVDRPEVQIPRTRTIRQVGKVRAELACLEGEELSFDMVSGMLDELLESCLRLGVTVAKTFFYNEGVMA